MIMLLMIHKVFHDGGPYHVEASLLICRANQNQDVLKPVVRFLCSKTRDCLHELFTQESLFMCCLGQILSYFLRSPIYSNTTLKYVATVLT